MTSHHDYYFSKQAVYSKHFDSLLIAELKCQHQYIGSLLQGDSSWVYQWLG